MWGENTRALTYRACPRMSHDGRDVDFTQCIEEEGSVKFFSLVLIALLAATMLPAQTSAPKKTTTHATPAAKSPVDNVIELVKSGMSENLIIKSLKRTNKPIDLSTADMVKLREAGVSDNIIGVMLDPTSNPAPAGSASPRPAPISVAPASAPAPAAQPAPAPEPTPVASAPAPAPSGPPTQAEKKRVIVDEFDYSAVKIVRAGNFQYASRTLAKAFARC